MNKMILMAAGNSRRFLLGNKLLYEYKGKPLYRHGLNCLLEVCDRHPDWEIFVVSQYEEILLDIRDLGFKQSQKIQGVYSPDSKKGASYTIKTAIRDCGPIKNDEYVLFMVADQPEISVETIENLVRCRAEYPETACVCYNKKRGNPVMFRGDIVPELLLLEGDQGGKRVLRNHETLFVEAQHIQELYDIDTIEDLAL